ncbi:MAG: hypothetical protein ACRDF0_10420 [Candidatus Limnocylindria bacterium]
MIALGPRMRAVVDASTLMLAGARSAKARAATATKAVRRDDDPLGERMDLTPEPEIAFGHERPCRRLRAMAPERSEERHRGLLRHLARVSSCQVGRTSTTIRYLDLLATSSRSVGPETATALLLAHDPPRPGSRGTRDHQGSTAIASDMAEGVCGHSDSCNSLEQLVVGNGYPRCAERAHREAP